MTTQPGNPTRDPLPFGLSLAAGSGLTLMILALGFGVVQGADANTSIIGFAFIGGLLLLIVGVGGWLAVKRPFSNFDDINEPQYHGHHDHDHVHVHDASDEAHDPGLSIPATAGQARAYDTDDSTGAPPVLPHG